jgi:serine/threonine-protein kinase
MELLRFGDFEVDLRAGELRRAGARVRLQQQPFRVLVLLLERAGDVVTREELRQAIWPAGTFVEFNLGLDTAIYRLRSALGDSAETPQFVETLPRRGYRFIATLQSGIVSDALAPPEAPQQMVPLARRGRLFNRPQVRRFLLAGIGAAIIAGLSLSVVRWRMTPDASLDPDLVAVAPFDVLDPNLKLWHEGMVDVLSRNLDGAGPLRSVSPSVVVRRWSGRADPVSAIDLGRRTGARLVAFGQLLPASGDSVRLTATLLDVATHRSIAEVEVRDVVARIDRLTDSATFALLRAVERTRPIGAVRRTSLTATSLSALRAFLQGEQYFRRLAWDSALTSYELAVKLDETFAPALRRIWSVLAFTERLDSSSRKYVLRAAANNHDLAPRESLLVTADSLWAASGPEEPSSQIMRRLFGTLEEATHRYPDDPEVWYTLGEMQYHFGVIDEPEQILPTYDRAIGLDSAFAPAYVRPVMLALELGRPGAARNYIARYLRLVPRGDQAEGLEVVSNLLEPDSRSSVQTQQLLERVSTNALTNAFLAMRMWPDSNEIAIRVARVIAARWHATHPGRDARFSPPFLADELLFRGHPREASATMGTPTILAGLAVLGVAPDTVAAAFRRWLRDGTPSGDWLGGPVAWSWSSQGDVASMREYVRRATSLAASRPGEQGSWKGFWRFVASGGLAYSALARRDTNEALRRFERLLSSDTLCPLCSTERLTTAQLLAARNRYHEAAALLNQRCHDYETPLCVLWALERGRVNERLRNRKSAAEAYQYVVDVWRNAEPELQRCVGEARAGLRRLGTQP